MKILILHDSNFGNGERLGEVLEQEWREDGHTVRVANVSKVAPEEAAVETPDLLVLGAAIRKFRSSPATKRWIRDYQRAAKGGKRPHYGALYLTHGLPHSWAKGWGTRLHRKLGKSSITEHLYPQWLSGRVTAPEGPLVEGAEAAFRSEAREILRWMEDPALPR